MTKSFFAKLIMMIFTMFLFVCAFDCLSCAVDTDLSLLTSEQSQLWHTVVTQVNNKNDIPRIVIIQVGHEMEIPLYNNQDSIIAQDRHLFKQNIHKKVDWYLFQNQLNSSNIFDPCRGSLFKRNVQETTAGIYIYKDGHASYGLGIILVKPTHSFQWYNGTKTYSFDHQSNFKNGTELTLAFETMIYYNSNSDLLSYNDKINEIIQQAHMSMVNDNTNNLDKFFSLGNLSCQRHSQIVYDDLRLLTLVCMTKVMFKCPLQIGSTCWIENKRMSNIRFNINSLAFISDRTVTVRIDV